MSDLTVEGSKEGYGEVFHSVGQLKFCGGFKGNLLGSEGATEEYIANPLVFIECDDALRSKRGSVLWGSAGAWKESEPGCFSFGINVEGKNSVSPEKIES